MKVSSVSFPWNSCYITICCFSSDERLLFATDPHPHFHSLSEIERPQCFGHVSEIHAPKHDILILLVYHLPRKAELMEISQSVIPKGHRGPPPSTTQPGTRAAAQALATTACFSVRRHGHCYDVQTSSAASVLLLHRINVAKI